MRGGDTWAWGEFGTRFEPVLLAYARRFGIPAETRRELVLDLLADEGMKFAEGRGAVPAQLPAYLARALRNRYLNEKRSATRRAAAYVAAANASDPGASPREATPGSRVRGRADDAALHESVVEYACSEATLRAAREPDTDARDANPVMEQFVTHIRRHLTDEEQQILGWEERRVPHRQIAEWLDMSYDATTKRIWRLKRRLQALTAEYHTEIPAGDDRRELERLLRRSGATPPGRAVTSTAKPDDSKETGR
jgi:DNA-directed RNA polymerase specialized sigma24 family protein